MYEVAEVAGRKLFTMAEWVAWSVGQRMKVVGKAGTTVLKNRRLRVAINHALRLGGDQETVYLFFDRDCQGHGIVCVKVDDGGLWEASHLMRKV